MGWDSFATTSPTIDAVRQLLTSPGHDVVSIEQSGAIVYAACRDGDGIHGVVAVTEDRGWEPRRPTGPRARILAVKIMGESEGPFYYGASAELIASLTAPCRGYAEKWRDKCRQRHGGG